MASMHPHSYSTAPIRVSRFAIWRHRLFMRWSAAFRTGVELGSSISSLQLQLSESRSAFTHLEKELADLKIQQASLQAQLATARRESITHQTLREAAESREQEARKELISTLRALRPDIFHEPPVLGPEERMSEEGKREPMVFASPSTKARRERQLRAVLEKFTTYAESGGGEGAGLDFSGLGFSPSDDPNLKAKLAAQLHSQPQPQPQPQEGVN